MRFIDKDIVFLNKEMRDFLEKYTQKEKYFVEKMYRRIGSNIVQASSYETLILMIPHILNNKEEGVYAEKDGNEYIYKKPKLTYFYGSEKRLREMLSHSLDGPSFGLKDVESLIRDDEKQRFFKHGKVTLIEKDIDKWISEKNEREKKKFIENLVSSNIEGEEKKRIEELKKQSSNVFLQYFLSRSPEFVISILKEVKVSLEDSSFTYLGKVYRLQDIMNKVNGDKDLFKKLFIAIKKEEVDAILSIIN